MKKHLTEQNLIEYHFKLADDAQAKDTAAHLADCPQCNDALEKLKQKFSALDLIADEMPTASQSLIDKVIADAANTPLKKNISFKNPFWFSAAAAVLLIGLLTAMIMLPPITHRKQPDQYAKNLDEDLDSPLISSDNDRSNELASETKGKAPTIVATRSVVKSLAPEAAVALDSTEIPEQPYFPPASAIELVTLPKLDGVQLTIYNSADLTLVRQKRSITVKRGWNWLQFMWANTLIDPTSLSLEPLANSDKIDIQQLVYPAGLKDIGRWLIRSEVSGQIPFEITYLTSGLSWRAFYQGTLAQDEKTMHLKGYVKVANKSGEDFEKAQTRLIVGKVNLIDQIATLAKRKRPYGPDIPMTIDAARDGDTIEIETGIPVMSHIPTVGRLFTNSGLKPKEIIKEGLSEYFLYTIEGTEDLSNQWSKRLPSFDTEDIEITALYKFDQSRWADATMRFISFTNDTDHNLGQTPIPNGSVKVYRTTDAQNHLSYEGGTNIKYIPINEEIELNLGQVENVVVEPKLMDLKYENHRYDNHRNIVGWDELRKFKIEVRNTRDIPIKVEIKRNFHDQYWKVDNTGNFGEYEMYDLKTVKYTLKLEPNSKKVFQYDLREFFGTRQEDWQE